MIATGIGINPSATSVSTPTTRQEQQQPQEITSKQPAAVEQEAKSESQNAPTASQSNLENE